MAFLQPRSEDEWIELSNDLFNAVEDTDIEPPSNAPQKLSPAALAPLIDHTLLAPDATRSQITQLCREAAAHNFHAVCVRPQHVAHAVTELQKLGRVACQGVKSSSDYELGPSEVGIQSLNSDKKDAAAAGDQSDSQSHCSINVVSVIGFPVDDRPAKYSTEEKKAEAAKAVEDGATELDMVIEYEALVEASKNEHVRDKKDPTGKESSGADSTGGDENPHGKICSDIFAVRQAIPDYIILKVILETGQLIFPERCRDWEPQRHDETAPEPVPDRRGERNTRQQYYDRAPSKDLGSSLSYRLVIQACLICYLAGAQYVKTSTGFHRGSQGKASGATVDVVRLMTKVCKILHQQVFENQIPHARRELSGSREQRGADNQHQKHQQEQRMRRHVMKVKASGGIRTLDDVEKMFFLGMADRIGTSGSVGIMKECEKRKALESGR